MPPKDIDYEVRVIELLSEPKQELLKVLRHLDGWDEVRDLQCAGFQACQGTCMAYLTARHQEDCSLLPWS